MAQSMGSQRVRYDLVTEQQKMPGGGVQIQKRENGLLHQADMKRNEGWFPQSQRLPKVFSGNSRLGVLAGKNGTCLTLLAKFWARLGLGG